MKRLHGNERAASFLGYYEMSWKFVTSRTTWWNGMCERIVRTRLTPTLYKSDLNWVQLWTAIAVEFELSPSHLQRHRRTDTYHANYACERTTYYWSNRNICQFFGTYLLYMWRFQSQRKASSVNYRKIVLSFQIEVHAGFEQFLAILHTYHFDMVTTDIYCCDIIRSRCNSDSLKTGDWDDSRIITNASSSFLNVPEVFS